MDIEGINVIGKLPGADTTKSIIIGAHYDHLGMRGDSIFMVPTIMHQEWPEFCQWQKNGVKVG